jgi:hypothetical protein
MALANEIIKEKGKIGCRILEVFNCKENVDGEDEGVDEGEKGPGYQHVRVLLTRVSVVIVDVSVVAVKFSPIVNNYAACDNVKNGSGC